MKIEKDLRIAIIHAEKGQKTLNYDQRRAIRVKALQELIKTRKLQKQIKGAVALHNTLVTAINRINRWFEEIGTDYRQTDIHNPEKFKKAGGKYPTHPDLWKASKVIAELVEAEQNQMHKILKKYGINWT